MNEDSLLALKVLALVFTLAPLGLWIVYLILKATLSNLDAHEGQREGAKAGLGVSLKLKQRNAKATTSRAAARDQLVERLCKVVESLDGSVDAAEPELLATLAERPWRCQTLPLATPCADKAPGRPQEVRLSTPVSVGGGGSLRVRRRKALTADELAFLDVQRVGHKAFDKAFAVEASERGLVTALRSTPARKACARLFKEPGVVSLQITEDRLELKAHVKSGVGRKRLRSLFKELTTLAERFDPQHGIRLGPRLPEGPDELSERCPYCLDDLDTSEDCVSCDACGTALHAECRRELGRCPVLGCEGGSTSLTRRRVDS